MRGIRDKRGYVTVLTMVLGAICSVLLMQMISYTAQSRKQVMISKDLARYSSLMDSIIDYTAYGIKNRWCFDSTWSRDASAGCTLASPYSTEALLLTHDAYKSLVDYQRSQNAARPAISKDGVITATIDVATWATGHPLSKALMGLLQATNGSVKTIEITVTRVQDDDYPARGDEAIIRVDVTLKPSNSAPSLFGTFDKVSSSATFLVTPRELSYFSVVVPKDLRLDGGAAGVGDLSIPSGGGGNGVNFGSPLYVDGDIYLPNKNTKNSTTFANKVVMGGKLYRDGSLFAPDKPGGLGSQYFSDLDTFGGFARGIDAEPVRDPGLPYFAGLQTGTSSSSLSVAKDCQEVNYAEMNLAQTRMSDMIFYPLNPGNIAVSGSGPVQLSFRLGFSGRNRFTMQDYGVRKGTGADGAGISASGSNRSILNAVVAVSSEYTTPRGASSSHEKKFDYMMSFNSSTNAPSGIGYSNTITISTKSTSLKPGIQDLNLVDFTISLEGPNLSRIKTISIHIQGMDLAVFGMQDRRLIENGGSVSLVPTLADSTHTRALDIGYQYDSSSSSFLRTTNLIASTNITGPIYYKNSTAPTVTVTGGRTVGGFSAPSGITGALPEDQIDGKYYTEFRSSCGSNETGRQSVSSAFVPGSWTPEYGYSPDTRNSWNFTDVPPMPFPDNTQFWVASIVPTCTIGPGLEYAAGFLVCDNFVIQPRSKPFTFIGTIVAKNFSIDASAIAQGVKFMSIYHPAATYLLREWGMLKNFNNVNCTNAASPTPIWHPEASLQDYYDLYHCNAVSLRNLSDPFTWTTMSPDCATPDGKVLPECVRRPHRFLMREISRKGDLQ